jgi:hypothetical protein
MFRLGMLRQYLDLNRALIEISAKGGMSEEPIIVHEIVHLGGGDEIDARVIAAAYAKRYGYKYRLGRTIAKQLRAGDTGKLIRTKVNPVGHVYLGGLRVA